jgi:hypothetical protein
MKLSIFGTSKIIHHHIKAAKNNSFEIFSICTSNKNSKNIKEIAKKYQIQKIYYNWKLFIENSYQNKSSVLIAGRIKDNKKVLSYCLKHNLKVLIEKPIFIKDNEFNDFLVFKKNIFLAYNRIYYQNILKIKKIIKKEVPNNIYIKCPESNIKNIVLNTCHIISIAYHLIGKLTLIKKIKNRDSIFCIFKSKKKIPVYIHINFGAPDNFSFEFNFKKIRATLNPIEKLTIFDKLIKKKYRNNNIYHPNISETINEYKLSKFKPGFNLQYLNFNKFLRNQKSEFINISDAREIVSICNKIIN